jgi:hypothetical protein
MQADFPCVNVLAYFTPRYPLSFTSHYSHTHPGRVNRGRDCEGENMFELSTKPTSLLIILTALQLNEGPELSLY